MALVHEHLNKLKSGIETIRKVGVPTEWEFERIQECVNGLFTFAKFKAGDSVEMKDTYPVNVVDSWGWMSYRHLFKKGSKATIISVDWYKGQFLYLIEFDEKTWISDKNEIKPITSTSHFNLSEKWLTSSKRKTKKRLK